MAEVFISYSRADFEFAKNVHDALIEQKRTVWMDLDDIPKGTKFRLEMLAGIEQADNFLFLISPNSAKSDMCRVEIEHAVDNKKRMIAIVCREVPDGGLHPAIAEINWINGTDRTKAVEQLVDVIDI